MRAYMARRGMMAAAGLTAALVALGLLSAAWGAGAVTERASVSATGVEGDRTSRLPAVSADGRFVAFSSDASTLLPDDTSGWDIFLRDRQTGITERVSVAGDGTAANRSAHSPSISGDARYVVFSSDADNLAPSDTNGAIDIFVRDRVAGTTDRVSIATDGTQASNDSLTPSISADGRYVTFTSLATNLVPGDTNDERDVFVHDRELTATERVSVSSDGVQGNFGSGGPGAGPAQVTSDGRYVVFGSFASNLVPGDTNESDDVFLRDRLTGTTERVSVSSESTQGASHSIYPDISDDGRYVVFHSHAEDLVPNDSNAVSDIFLRDRQTGVTTRLGQSPGGGQSDGSSQFAVISADGRAVAFESEASNLVPDDTNGSDDVFVHYLESGEMERISVADDGSEGDGSSTFVAISEDGSALAYQSSAANLVPGDTNSLTDVFVWGKALLVPATPTPTPAAGPGDVNCDGVANSVDAALILQFSAGLIDVLGCPDAADVNDDRAVNAIDAALVLQLDAGLLDSLQPR